MKKLNRKGFTLIELLAVIVILAIIVVVTVPTIITTISDARVNSIWNLAGETANSYDTGMAQELLSPGVALKGIAATGTWQCIASLKNSSNDTLADVLELKEDDLALTKGYDGKTTATTAPISENGTVNITASSCSAIRIKDTGGAEVILIAKDGGKFAVSGYSVYGYTKESNGNKVARTSTGS